jgi:hypothetical protein
MRPKPPAPSKPADCRRWKSRAAAVLERQGISPGVARERDLRKMSIGGAPPEQAAAGADDLLEHPLVRAHAVEMSAVENEADD